MLANTWKICRSFSIEIDYRTSFHITSKLRMKVGCRRARSKTKTGNMNIIRNQSERTYTGKGDASDQNHALLVLLTSLLLRCIKGGGRIKYLSYLNVHVSWMVPYFTRNRGWLNPFNNLIMTHLVVISNIFCFRSNALPIWRASTVL